MHDANLVPTFTGHSAGSGSKCSTLAPMATGTPRLLLALLPAIVGKLAPALAEQAGGQAAAFGESIHTDIVQRSSFESLSGSR
jgi:hypothetical protein